MAEFYVNAEWSSKAAGETVTVGGKNYTIGTDAFATINAAVNQAKTVTEKVTVEIAEGEYTENISFGVRTFVEDGKTYVGGITFKAAADAEVTINGYFQCNATAADIKDVAFDGLTITNSVRNGGYFAPIMFGDNYSGKKASGIEIKNCTLNSTAADGTSSGIALAMGLVCDGITVANNTINADCGVYGGDGNLISNTDIIGNTMNGNEAVPSYNYWGVIYIYNSGDGNVVDGNTIDNSALNALKVNKGAGITFTDNTITDCGEVKFTDGSVVSGNTVDGEEMTFPMYDGAGTLFVCQGVAGASGAVVIIDGKGYTVGTDVVSSFVEALKNVSADTEKIEVIGNVTEDIPAEAMEVALGKDLLISGNGGTVTLNNGGYKTLVFGPAEGAENIGVKFSNIEIVAPKTQIIFGNNASADDSSLVYLPVNVTIDADSTVSAYVTAVEYGSHLDVLEGGKFFSTGEVMNIKGSMTASGNEAFEPAAETLTADDRQIIAHYMWNHGTVELNDTYATIYSQLRMRGADSTFTADNSLIELGKKVDGTWLSNPSANGVGWANIDGTMTLTNNSILKSNGATGKGGYGMTVNAGAEFNVESGSTAEFSAGVKNDGAVNVENGTLIVGNSWTDPGTQPPATDLANNGTVTVSGKSTLDIAGMTGNLITFAEGATLVDSNINYTGDKSFRFDGVTFEGDNTINSGAYATSGMSFTVAEGGSLTSTGARWALGGTGIWDINGTIKDAKALTDDEIAELKATLDINGISMSTGGGEAVMNVDNAYFTFGSGHITSKNTNASGGKIVMNFTNSVVKSAYKYAVNPTKAGYDASKAPEIVLNVKDSVFAINNYFTNNNANGTVTVDNSDFTATAFGNTGKFTAQNGSVVSFALVNNALGDWSGKGSLNAGTMTIDASDMTIANKTASLEFYNVGSITLSNGATLTLDRFVNAEANDLTGGGNINTTFADMVGDVTITADSRLTVSTLFTNNGTITIDAEGFSGTNKVIDLSGTESLKDKIAIENLGEGVSVIYSADGDVIISDASQNILYVSDAYAGKAPGTVLEDGKVIGVNAFDSLTGAVKALGANTEKIEVASDITEALSGNTYSGNIVAAEGKKVTITDSANNTYVNFTDTVLGKDITVDAKYFYLYGDNTFNGDVKSSSTFYSSGKLILNGNAEVYTAMSRYYVDAEDGIYVVGTAAAGEGKNAAVQFKANNYLGHYSGTFSVKDTAAEFGYILLNGDTDGDGYSKAQLVLDNAKVSTIGGPNTQPGQVLMNGDSSIIATNGSVLDFRGPKDFAYISMGANNSISLTDSEMYLGKDGQGSNTLAGKITLTNSKLNSLGKLNSTAAITIDATSSIVATAITGTGTITIDVKGYTGDTFKAIDVNSAIDNTVKLTNASNKYYLTYGEDGDVYVNKSPDFVYVSSDYNSSTEGWGVTKFSSWDGAYAFTSVNAKKATMVFEKTTTVSGNCFPKQADGVAAVIVKDGATVGNAQSKWDAVFAMTIEAGGILQSARPITAAYGNTHVKNKWIIGEAGADKQAKILFVNGKNDINYQTMSIALLSGLNRSITTNNALIEVGDMGLQANASFTDTILTIDGILAIKGTALYKTTMTDTTVTVKGHNLMNENTYYSTVGTILSTLTMDNSSIVVDDGAADTVAEKVWLGYTANTANTLTMNNGSSITIEDGAEVEVANNVTMTDSTITAGDINAGTVKPANSSFYFNGLEKGKVYYAVIYDAEGNEIETIVRTSLNASTFYPKFSALPVGDYTAKCFKDEAKTELHQEKTYSFVAQGSLDLNTSNINADKITLAGGNLTMDYKSTIAFNEIAGGYVTVKDIDSYIDNEGVNDGTYKLLDYTGNGTMEVEDYKAILNNAWSDNYVVLGDDLYLTDQESNIIHVNSAWAGTEVGTEIEEGGYLYGHNAAGSIEEVAGMIATDGFDTFISLESDLESTSVDFQYGNGDITFTSDKAVTVKQTKESDWTFVVGDVSPVITIGENVTFEIYSNNSGLYVYYGAGLNVEGTVTGGNNWGCTYLAFGKHTVASTGTISTGRVHLAWSDLTVEGDAASDRTDAHIDTNYLLIEESTFTANNAIINAGAVHDSNNGGLRYGASTFDINNSKFTAVSVTLKHEDSVLDIDSSEFTAGSVANDGTINVTGENTLKIDGYSGDGWIYMKDASLDAESSVNGANVRFAGGENTIDGATVTGGRFQVGTGLYQAVDENVDSENGVVVNVKNNAHIGGIDGGASPFGGWVGSAYYDKQEDKDAAMTGASYTLNIENSIAEFGYMHVSHDGIMNVTGNADELRKINNTDYTFRSGYLNINGTVTIDNASAMVFNTNVSVDNNTATPGKLVITNGAVFYAKHEDNGITANFKISNTGIVEVSNNAVFNIGEKDAVLNIDAAGGKLNVTSGATLNAGDVTNNGTVTVDGANLAVAGTLTNNGTVTVSGESTVNIGTLSGTYLRIENGTLVGESNIGGNIRTYGDFALEGTLTVKQTNMYGTSTVKDGAVFNGSTTIVGGGSKFTLENGGTINSRFFNVVGGTADINGAINLNHSDPRQKLLQIHEDGVANINEGGAVTITRHNAVVNAGGTLNVNGGSLVITPDTVNVAADRGGVIYNDGTVNVTDGTVDIKNLNNNGKVNISGGEVSVADTVTNSGAVSISGGVTTAASIINNGTVEFKNNVTVNTVISGNAVDVASGAVIYGSLTADLNAKGNFTLNADYSGIISGKKVVTVAEESDIRIADGSKISYIAVADGIVFNAGETLAGAAVKGTDKNNTITVSDSVFTGNKFSGAKLALVDADDFVAVDVDLALISSVNGFEVTGVNGFYTFIDGSGNVNLISKVDGGIKISAGGNGEAAITDVKKIDVKKDDFTLLENTDISMAAGNTSIKVAAGKAGKGGAVDIMEFAVGSILKSENGGKTTLTGGNYTDIVINGDFEAVGSISMGKNSSLEIAGTVYGSNASQKVSIGSGATAVFDAMKFDAAAGAIDKDTFTAGAGATVYTGEISGLESLKLSSGNKNVATNMLIEGDFTAFANNTITLGNYAGLEINGMIDNGGVDSGTGTTIKIGTNSGMIVDDEVNGLAGLTVGKNSFFAAAGLEGTDKNNKISLGTDATVLISGDLELMAGNNSIVLGKAAGLLVAGSVRDVRTITTGTEASIAVSGDIDGVKNLTAGKDAYLSAENLYGTAENDKFKLGSGSKVELEALNMGDGVKDTITLSKGAELYLNSISGVEVITAAKGSEIWFMEGGAEAVSSISGTWKNADIYDMIGSLDTANGGSVFANEWDVYTSDILSDCTMLLEGDEDVALQFSLNGSDWQIYDGGISCVAGDSLVVRVSVADEAFDKKNFTDSKSYSFTATLA